MTNNQPIDLTQFQLDEFEHPAWDEPIICRVEVDLPAWLTQLTGTRHWEVCGEDEDETCISFLMREKIKDTNEQHKTSSNKQKTKQAEVTLYHNGYAIVDVDGKAVFDGSLTAGTSGFAHLSYYHESGEPILLN